jgi:hypothetical protein
MIYIDVGIGGGGFYDVDVDDENNLWIKTKDGYDFFKYVINFDVSEIKNYLNDNNDEDDNDNEYMNSLVLQYINLYIILNTDLGSHWINLFIRNEDNNCKHRFFNFVPKYKGYDNYSINNHNGIFNINEWYLIMSYTDCTNYYNSGNFPSWFNSTEGKQYLMFGNFINKYGYLNKVIFTMNADDVFYYFDNNLNTLNKWLKYNNGRGYEWLDSNIGILWLNTSKIAANWLLTIEGRSFLSKFPKYTGTEEFHKSLESSNYRWFYENTNIRWFDTKYGKLWFYSENGLNFINSLPIMIMENHINIDTYYIIRVFNDWINKNMHWLKSESGKKWLVSNVGKVWLNTKNGEDWISETDDGKIWLESGKGFEFINSSMLNSYFLSTKVFIHWVNKHLDWLKSENGNEWLVSNIGKK